ncbi:MAG: phosphopantetheine-binding protein [Bacilli bacterium]|nr:phosphopantetheine-binding protein [Bacilli bacterium]MDD4809230.1 phosphopantetheine-binding protein [Bacilli bacterium]
MFEVIKEVLIEELAIEDEITMDSNLRDDLLIDSLMAAEMSLRLEEKYDVSIEEAKLVKLKTISDVIELLKRKGVE